MPMAVDGFFCNLQYYPQLGNNHYIHKYSTYKMSCIEVQQQDFRVCIQSTVQTTAVNFSEVLSFSVSGLIKTNWDLPQLLQLVQQGHSEIPSLSQLLVFSTQPLHELFQKIGFLHVPLDRLFLQIQSSPKEKVFIYTWTLTNSEKCL